MKELRIEADTANLNTVLAFIDEQIEGCSVKTQTKIDLAAEEIFVNIANYAYPGSKGYALVKVEVSEEPDEVVIEFIDEGVPYDPLAKADPDVNASLEEREAGGLGIFMAKKSMDSMSYEYKDGCNVLKMTKALA